MSVHKTSSLKLVNQQSKSGVEDSDASNKREARAGNVVTGALAWQRDAGMQGERW